MDQQTSTQLAPGQALYHAWLAPHSTHWPLHHCISSILAARSPAEVLAARREALQRQPEPAPTFAPAAGLTTPEDEVDEALWPDMSSDWIKAIDAVAAAALEMLRLQGLCASHTAHLEDTREKLKVAEEAANTDALTGLPNRRNFLEQAERQLAIARRYGAPFTLLLLDVDHFKSCNDVYGHAAGDTVLKAVATALETEIRHSDLAARFGGEEFTVLCPNTDINQALLLAERLREAVQDLLLLSETPGQELPPGVTVSIGMATHLAHESEVADVLARADEALYQAKRAGRNRVVVNSSKLHAPGL
jgi:diguanylate cyclase (GGDEF)-like protein